MPTRLADLDELLLTCRNEGSKELIREAVLCYKAGAFRSAIVNTWIAVAFDLVEKLRDLSLGGDKQAEAEVNYFETIQASRDLEQALKFERELLTKCRDKFELISPLEFLDLDRLAEDRNRCAHPNLLRYSEIYSPSAELVRAHLRSAIEHVLQQPPRVGKAALDQLYRDVQAEFFPVEMETAKRVLLESPLARAKTNVIRSFVLGIAAKVLKEELSVKEVSKRLAAIRATSEIHREYFLELIRTHFPDLFQRSEDIGLKYLLIILRHIPETIGAVTDGMEARLLRYIETAPQADIPIVIRAGLKVPKLRDSVMKRLAGLDEESLAKVIGSGSGPPPDEVIEKALGSYAESGNWAKANSLGIKVIQPLLKVMNKVQVLRLFEIAEQNTEIQGSFIFTEIVNDIKTSGILSKREFRSEMQRREWVQFADDDEPPTED